MASSFYSEKDIKSWNDLQKIENNSLIFRGQGDYGKGLETSIERLCKKICIHYKGAISKKEYTRRVEESLLRDFTRRYHQYDILPPNIDDDLEWLSIMQHYGAPTRLLDWSYSVFVALYFALENAEEKKDSALWAINHSWAVTEVCKLFPKNKGN
jgi:hypothetical protein